MSKTQVNMYLDHEFAEHLDGLAERFGRRSRNTVIQEVLEHYLEFWVQAEEAKKTMLDSQRQILGKGNAATSAARKKIK